LSLLFAEGHFRKVRDRFGLPGQLMVTNGCSIERYSHALLSCNAFSKLASVAFVCSMALRRMAVAPAQLTELSFASASEA